MFKLLIVIVLSVWIFYSLTIIDTSEIQVKLKSCIWYDPCVGYCIMENRMTTSINIYNIKIKENYMAWSKLKKIWKVFSVLHYMEGLNTVQPATVIYLIKQGFVILR